MQADAGAFEHVLAQRRGLGADDVPVAVRELGVEARGEADRHRQRRGGRARGTVAHADPHGAVGDPEAGDPELVDRGHVPFDLDLSGQLVEVLPGFGRLRREGVDVDRLHRTVQLGDLLLQRHGRDELLGPLAGRQGRVLPGRGFRQGRTPSVGVAVCRPI